MIVFSIVQRQILCSGEQNPPRLGGSICEYNKLERDSFMLSLSNCYQYPHGFLQPFFPLEINQHSNHNQAT